MRASYCAASMANPYYEPWTLPPPPLMSSFFVPSVFPCIFFFFFPPSLLSSLFRLYIKCVRCRLAHQQKQKYFLFTLESALAAAFLLLLSLLLFLHCTHGCHMHVLYCTVLYCTVMYCIKLLRSFILSIF